MKYSAFKWGETAASRVVIGCETLGGTDWGTVNPSEIRTSIRTALDLGINVFDTADVYGLGRSEEQLADVLGEERKKVIISTKFGLNWEQDTNGSRARIFRDATPARVFTAVDASLRRLRLDQIPLYFLHWPDPNVPLEATLEALNKCRETGKIAAVGLANFPADSLREACQYMPIAAAQFQYSLLERSIEENQLECCRELKIQPFVYGTLAQGLLTGKYGPSHRFGVDDRRHRLPAFQPDAISRMSSGIDLLRVLAVKLRQPPSVVAVAWALSNSSICGAIVGIKDRHQLKEAVQAAAIDLDPETVAELNEWSDRWRGLKTVSQHSLGTK